MIDKISKGTTISWSINDEGGEFHNVTEFGQSENHCDSDFFIEFNASNNSMDFLEATENPHFSIQITITGRDPIQCEVHSFGLESETKFKIKFKVIRH